MELKHSKYTREMYDRHAAVLQKVACICASGYPASNLTEVASLLTLAKASALASPDLVLGPLCSLLSLAAVDFCPPSPPPSTQSELNVLQESETRLVQVVCEMTSLGDERVNAVVAEVLFSNCGRGDHIATGGATALIDCVGEGGVVRLKSLRILSHYLDFENGLGFAKEVFYNFTNNLSVLDPECGWPPGSRQCRAG